MAPKDFGWAIMQLKAGERVQREGWNGKAPVKQFVPPSREPVVFEGLCYVLLSTGNVAVCDEVDYEMVAQQKNWAETRGYAYFTSYEAGSDSPKTVTMHQLLNPDWEQTDHENGDRLDNRRSNLRRCTSQQNNANRASSGGTSKYKGVSMDSSRGQWISSIQLNRKTKHLGRFAEEKEAARAYDAAAFEAYGEFAKLNFPKPRMYLALQRHDANSKMTLPYIYMKTVQGDLVPWLASQTDMLAEDWDMFEPSV